LDCIVMLDPRLADHEMPGGLIELEEGDRLPRAGERTVFVDDEGVDWRCRVASIQRVRGDYYQMTLTPQTEPLPRPPKYDPVADALRGTDIDGEG
jgi:hypothetical protein